MHDAFFQRLLKFKGKKKRKASELCVNTELATRRESTTDDIPPSNLQKPQDALLHLGGSDVIENILITRIKLRESSEEDSNEDESEEDEELDEVDEERNQEKERRDDKEPEIKKEVDVCLEQGIEREPVQEEMKLEYLYEAILSIANNNCLYKAYGEKYS